MSRAVFFGLDNYPTAQLPEIDFPRGWAINNGAESRISLGESDLLPEIQFGALAMVEHPRLPPWAGMIDAPWKGILPCQAVIYDAAYLLSIRAPERTQKLTGTTGSMALQLIEQANAQEWLGIVPGDIRADDTERTEPFDQRDFWTQLVELVEKAGLEMRLRPARGNYGRLELRLDIVPRLGVDTGYLFHDGEGGNLEVTNFDVKGPIVNRVYASGDQATRASRTVIEAQEDTDSRNRYRLHSKFYQVAGVTERAILTERAQVYLAQNSRPHVEMRANIVENDRHPASFLYADLGNTAMVHASAARLPGGVRGWRGMMRIEIMSYDDVKKRVTVTMTGAL